MKYSLISIFKIISGYFLAFVTSETMKLLGVTEEKIIKEKNGENTT